MAAGSWATVNGCDLHRGRPNSVRASPPQAPAVAVGDVSGRLPRLGRSRAARLGARSRGSTRDRASGPAALAPTHRWPRRGAGVYIRGVEMVGLRAGGERPQVRNLECSPAIAAPTADPAVPDHPAAAAEQGADERDGEKARAVILGHARSATKPPVLSRLWKARYLPGSVIGSDERDCARQVPRHSGPGRMGERSWS